MTRRAQPDFTHEFKREAVRLTETSVRTIKEIADVAHPVPWTQVCLTRRA